MDAEFDIVFIGSGFTSLGIASVLTKLSPGLKIAFISLEERPGGIWTDAASTVKLHQQTYFYALPGIRHDNAACHTDAMHQASSAEVRKYASKVASHVKGQHIVGKVLSVESSGAVRQVTYSCNSGKSKMLRCRHVIQATGFDSYSGAPRMLGVPKEVHTSYMDKVVEKLFCKRCLLVGSGKSSIDAAKLLIQQKNSVRCIYRSATAYMRFGFNSPMARLIQYFDPGRHFSILEQMPEDWKYDYSVDLKTWDWYVVGDPRSCQQVLQKTRGGIIPLRDYVFMNLLLHGFGVLADADPSKVHFEENADGTVSCSLFPGEVFDYVVSATGYTGTKQLFPHCISAITPITDLHVHNAYMMGYLIHEIMGDNEKMASWNAFASHKPEFPWHKHYQHVRQWCGRHVDETMQKAKAELDEDMRLASEVPQRVGKVSKMTVLFLEQLAQWWISSCRLCITLMWRFSPPCLSRAVLSSGILRP